MSQNPFGGFSKIKKLLKDMRTLIVLAISCAVFYQAQAQHQKEILQKILHQIHQQFGRDERPPGISFQKAFHMPALYSQNASPQITLDTRLYGLLLKTLGSERDAKIAVAFILGHELVHHNYHHSSGGFSFGVSNHFEKMADVWGSYYAHLAGYSIDTTIYTKTLRTIYQFYDVKPCKTCPSIENRISFVTQKIKDIQTYQLAEVFQAAKLFWGLGKYQEASLLLEFPYSKGYKSAEIRNNLAVIYMKQYLNTLSKTTKLFMYPFELDLYGKNRCPHFFPKGEALLQRAEVLLNQVIWINRVDTKRKYLKAYVNKACLDLIRGKYATAIETIQDIKKYSSMYPASAWAVLSLAYCYTNQPKKARECFRKARKIEASRFNEILYRFIQRWQESDNFQEVLNQIPKNKLGAKITSIQNLLFKTAGTNLNPAAELKVFNTPITADDDLKQWVVVSGEPNFPAEPPYLEVAKIAYHKTYKHWRVKWGIKKRNHTKETAAYYLFSTQDNFVKTSALGIKIGDPVSKLIQVYKYPQMLLNNLYVYLGGNIFFEVQNGKVKGWTVWKVS